MGLCKCRNVTNLFCFEHRKNVCEKCLVSDHQRCVVRSYLQWLQDSDFDPVCALCKQSLENGGVVRLMCYDVFHWECIDKYAKSFPAHTAPAGYVCPTCQTPIIPPDNAGSLVAQQLRQTLADAPWAQMKALPALSNAVVSAIVPAAVLDGAELTKLPASAPLSSNGAGSSSIGASAVLNAPRKGPRDTYSNGAAGGGKILMHDHDHDDDKYGQRRGIGHLLRQCFGLRSLRKAFFALLVIAVISFVVIGISSRILQGPPTDAGQ